ncbi:hypothetical protein Mmc1_3251 [Magnetococcus marinus MC-1]|uniref:Uncharacterized protein n=1 Tax=Magnetococcus marinus (strain ATCC BAA-1437 / JCM 17883 / MC-1) TaxID=156889 RepID=A0LCP8_MAGMM|nr:hypothetical protein [Magnetococcus marinus]ABK45741.1 hypothetical protein Mmc1_3251 [Magnetococcus marinus MC-1]
MRTVFSHFRLTFIAAGVLFTQPLWAQNSNWNQVPREAYDTPAPNGYGNTYRPSWPQSSWGQPYETAPYDNGGYGRGYYEHRTLPRYQNRRPWGEVPFTDHAPSAERDERYGYGREGYGERSGYGREGYGERSGYGREGYGERSGYGREGYGERSGYGREGYGERSGYGRDSYAPRYRDGYRIGDRHTRRYGDYPADSGWGERSSNPWSREFNAFGGREAPFSPWSLDPFSSFDRFYDPWATPNVEGRFR